MPYTQKKYKKIFRIIKKNINELEKGQEVFYRAVITDLKNSGYKVTSETIEKIRARTELVLAGIKEGAKVVVKDAAPVMRNEDVAKASEKYLNRIWSDGRVLSNRLWKISARTENEISRLLQNYHRYKNKTDSLVYELQRAVEQADGGEFTVKTLSGSKWTKDLASYAKLIIDGNGSMDKMRSMLKNVDRYIERLEETGTKRDALRFVSKIRQAIDEGSTKIVDNAIKFKTYDKQLYHLKRIVRTELANAAHNAVIDLSKNDPDIIGYKWSLSASHPKLDICDYYASVDFGLGKGVWPKHMVPSEKPHPHCMCQITPRVTKSKTKGEVSFKQFADKLTDRQKRAMFPEWAYNAINNGVNIDKLVRNDGLFFVTKLEAAKRLGNKFKNLTRKKIKQINEKQAEKIKEKVKEKFLSPKESNEFLAVYTDEGIELSFSEGGKTSVSISDDLANKIMDNNNVIFSHNHPRGTSLSDYDFLTQHDMKAKEIRALAVSEGIIYVGRTKNRQLLIDLYKKIGSFVKQELDKFVFNDKYNITLYDADIIYSHIVNKLLARAGAIKYNLFLTKPDNVLYVHRQVIRRVYNLVKVRL